jgi:hypothetical protein
MMAAALPSISREDGREDRYRSLVKVGDGLHIRSGSGDDTYMTDSPDE